MAEIMDVDTEPVIPAQTTAPDTEPTGWMSPTGELRESAPDNIRELFEKKKWNNVNQVVDGYIDLEKLVGAGEHLFLPESAEDIEGWDKVYNLLGRPPTYDKYEFTNESGLEISDELINSFKQLAHKEGYTQKQLAGAIQFQLDAVIAQGQIEEKLISEQQEANVQVLKQKYGEANYGAKITGARIIADSLGIYKTLEEKGLASDPAIIEMLVNINKRTAEDVITSGAEGEQEKTSLD
ncbi:hypothetical protein LCGC14_2648920, partial [marine sediment metagenome]